MYKILFFLHKTTDENIINFFNEKIVKKLCEITGITVYAAQIESNLLLDQKYSLFCEISANEKEDMDRLMYSKAGKELTRVLTDFHQNLTVIAVNYKK